MNKHKQWLSQFLKDIGFKPATTNEEAAVIADHNSASLDELSADQQYRLWRCRRAHQRRGLPVGQLNVLNFN